MKSFERIKSINGKEYMYLITPYYDKNIKKIRQKSKYIGKYENGKVTRPIKPLPTVVYSYGEFIPYNHIMEKLEINKILKEICPQKMNIIKCLVLNRLLRPLAVQNIQRWVEGTILSNECKQGLSSQSLSNFLADIGSSSLPQHFMQRFIKRNNKVKSVVYDLTSLSSYSKLNSLLEYGYNKDGNGLPQFNLSLAVDKERGIPLLYDIYPGSIKDVSVMENTIKRMKDTGMNFSVLVLDRGFFSTSNIEDLVTNELPFIIGAPYTLKEIRSIISKFHEDVENPDLVHMYNKKSIFVKDVSANIGTRTIKGYLFHDMKREQEEKNSFYIRLYEIRNALLKVRIQKGITPEKKFESIARDLKLYFEYKITGDHFDVFIKKKAVAQRIHKMGKMVILYNGDFTWEQCLSMYKEKDVVEKCFRTLKSDILASPLNAQKDEVVKGLVFVMFVALVLRFKLFDMMRCAKLEQKYSIGTLGLELEKIKKVKLQNGDTVTTEVTKKQRELLGAMGLCA